MIGIKGVTTGEAKGHKGSFSMDPKLSNVKNDLNRSHADTSGRVTVKGDFPNSEFVEKSVKGLEIKSGKGWKNKP